ncbi:MAG: Sua5/YciO/YrdC/YwlC family protein [Comamonadaceae bacterium]|nr:Sua5/YciO/YrdC/YwlC family protein [Comamonadaceae bacterium]
MGHFTVIGGDAARGAARRRWRRARRIGIATTDLRRSTAIGAACTAAPSDPRSASRRPSQLLRARRAGRPSPPRPSMAWAPTRCNAAGGGEDLRRQGPARRPPADRASAARRGPGGAGRARCRRRRDALALAFWPGPLTLILKRQRRRARHRHRRPGHASACACPTHPWRARLLAGTSPAASPRPRANRFGRISPTTAEHVRAGTRRPRAADPRRRALPRSASNRPSSICARGAPRILRPGAIGAAEIEEVLGMPVLTGPPATTRTRRASRDRCPATTRRARR